MGSNTLITYLGRTKDVPEGKLGDVSYLAHILRAEGYSAELYDIYEAWSEISDDYCAGWLIPEAFQPDEITPMLLAKFSY